MGLYRETPEGQAYLRAYVRRPVVKARRREATRQYDGTDRGRAVKNAWEATAIGRLTRQRTYYRACLKSPMTSERRQHVEGIIEQITVELDRLRGRAPVGGTGAGSFT